MFADRVLQPSTGLPFINADHIAAEQWPDDAEVHAYDSSLLAAQERTRLMEERVSFITETVFSHPSKVALVQDAVEAGYLVYLHVILTPEDTSVHRVAFRVRTGGHSVPEHKIRQRYSRLWALLVEARTIATRTVFYDNSSASSPYRVVATYSHGLLEVTAQWPVWVPPELT